MRGKRSAIAKSSSKGIADLDSVSSVSGKLLGDLTAALRVPREVVADDDQIAEALSGLPRLLRRMPPELRDERIARACVAIACGLFDSAINYVWNASVVELRKKVLRFGLHVIPQVLDDKSFDEQSLLDLKDSELLSLCLRLNLITDQSYFFLDQCRATRNSYSVAHPAAGDVDEDEVLNFVSRCQKHALSNKQNPKGVDTKELLRSVHGSRLKKVQREAWEERLRGTFDAQRELLFGMLHGIYCDPDSGEEARVNALALCSPFENELTPKSQSMLVDRHQAYKAKGDDARYKASQIFFEKMGLVDLLGKSEIHSMVTSAARSLLRVHDGWDNFYNEPPFADRLAELTRGVAIPDSAQGAFVEAVVLCGIGNTYGVSAGAMPSYRAMIKAFSPREIGIMLSLPRQSSRVKGRLKVSADCAGRFSDLIRLLDKSSVPTAMRSEYRKRLVR